MKNFKVIEKSRLNEFTMAKLIGGRPCNERNTNCGATGYSCNAAFGISDPCGNFGMVLIALETMELVLPT